MPTPIRMVFTNEDLQAAFRAAESLCRKPESGIARVAILVPTKANASTSTTLGAHLGENVCKAFEKGQQVSICGLPASLVTKKTLTNLPADTLVICVYASQDMMDRIDSFGRPAAIIALPYAEHVIDPWISAWSPLINDIPQAQIGATISDPIVRIAMEGLSGRINLSHGFLNPRDKEAAVRTLRILRRMKHVMAAENVRAWAVAHEWRPSAANELGELVSKTMALKTAPKIDRLKEAKSTYDYWVEKSGQQ